VAGGGRGAAGTTTPDPENSVNDPPVAPSTPDADRHEDGSTTDTQLAHDAGVRAVVAAVAALTETGANRATPCPEWTVRELAQHLLCTARRFHRLLDASLAGRPEPVLLGSDLADLNRAQVIGAPWAPLDEIIVAFAASAHEFEQRAREHWDHGPFQRGGVSVGEALGIAAFEWHVHAWDLRRAAGQDYYPEHAEVLRQAWDSSVPHLRIDLTGDPWAAVLSSAGRSVPQVVVDPVEPSVVPHDE